MSRSVQSLGVGAIDCGVVPTPALALEAARRGVAAIMVTGSHIPFDRNGLKFYRADGEITKADEAGIDTALSAPAHALRVRAPAAGEPGAEVAERYIARYVDFFGPGSLAGAPDWRLSAQCRGPRPAQRDTAPARGRR